MKGIEVRASGAPAPLSHHKCKQCGKWKEDKDINIVGNGPNWELIFICRNCSRFNREKP